jgi:hypothetical protein
MIFSPPSHFCEARLESIGIKLSEDWILIQNKDLCVWFSFLERILFQRALGRLVFVVGSLGFEPRLPTPQAGILTKLDYDPYRRVQVPLYSVPY